MNDLISRQALCEYALNQKDKSVDPNDIMRFPSVQPRPRGRWVKISPAGIYECSNCGKNVMTDDINEYEFCHGCGCDMREEEQE